MRVKYDELNDYGALIPLYGKSYEPVKRLIVYSLLGNSLKGNGIRLGSLREDTRINVGVPIMSGHGKKDLKQMIKRSVESTDGTYVEPTSLHPEQLVGKTIVTGQNQDEYFQNRGYLNDDYVVVDEAIELLRESHMQDARNYINLALDPIGQNEVLKKSVDTPKGEEIRYFPTCSMALFFQPLPMAEEIVTRGLLRRFVIAELTMDYKERKNALKLSLQSGRKNVSFGSWRNLLESLSQKTFSWTFTGKAKREIFEGTKRLAGEGFKFNENVRNYTDIMFFTLRNYLVKFSCILGALDDVDRITLQQVRYAYGDLKQFWLGQVFYVEEKVRGSLSYGSKAEWKKKQTCLKILRKFGAYSEREAERSISDLLEEMSKKLDLSTGACRHYYLKLVGEGIVGRKKGQHDSKVWLRKKKFE